MCAVEKARLPNLSAGFASYVAEQDTRIRLSVGNVREEDHTITTINGSAEHAEVLVRNGKKLTSQLLDRYVIEGK